MAYTKYIDGVKPFTAAAAADITYQQLNEMQDQLRRIWGPREMNLLPAGGIADADDPGWVYNTVDWRTTTDDAELIVPLTLRTGSKIYLVHTVVAGDAADLTGGDIELEIYERGDDIGDRTAIDLTGGVANPWQGTAVTYAASNHYFATREISGIPVTIEEDKMYKLLFTAPSDVNAKGNVRIHWASIIYESATAP